MGILLNIFVSKMRKDQTPQACPRQAVLPHDCRHHRVGVLLDIAPVEEKCCSCLLTIAPTAATLLVVGLHCGRHAVVNHTGDVRTV